MKLVRSVLAAYAALIFGSTTLVGLLVLAATFATPSAGVCGLTAVLAALAVAHTLGYRTDFITTGYYLYSPLLVGVALGHLRMLDPQLLGTVAVGGALAAMVTAVFGELLYRAAGLPVLALPFVLVTALLSPVVARVGDDHAVFALTLPLPHQIDIALRAFGAIVFSPTQTTGIVVLLALAISSRIAMACAATGMIIAAVMAWLLGTSHVQIAMAYNAALSAIAIGAVWFVPGRAALVAAAFGAAAAAWLAAAMVWPLAWPFTLTTLLIVRALHLRAPGRMPLPALDPGASPERNLELSLQRERLGVCVTPQIELPFFGAWAITQGMDGEHTHQGPWAAALDFEALDERGFPFRGDGTRLEDYRCFGLPVLAPVAGVVIAVHEDEPDNPPGEIDTEKPWGNAVVLRFGSELYVLLAHLRSRSVRVAIGQSVIAGQPIASCGASGRSPRPHLHLQVQRSPELGAPAIQFKIANYVVDANRYVAVGIPQQHEHVSRPVSSHVIDAFPTMQIGNETQLVLERGGVMRLRSEVGLLGERFLRDLDRGDRLYFTCRAGNLVLLAHDGASDAPLRALLYAMPRLPSVSGTVDLVDTMAASALLRWPTRLLHEVTRSVIDPIEALATITMSSRSEGVVVTTQISLGLRGRGRPRFRGRVELDHSGLRTVELVDARRSGDAVLRARRAA